MPYVPGFRPKPAEKNLCLKLLFAPHLFSIENMGGPSPKEELIWSMIYSIFFNLNQNLVCLLATKVEARQDGHIYTPFI